MSCEVCIGQDVDPDCMVTMLSDEIVTARKPHICGECMGLIQRGKYYRRYVGKWEGKIENYRTCLMCLEIRTVFTCGVSWTWGCLWEEMQESAFPELTTATQCFRELSPAAKAFVLDRWQKWKGLA